MLRRILAPVVLASLLPLAGLTAQDGLELEQVARARISAVYDVEARPPVGYALERGILRVLDLEDPTDIHEIGEVPFEAPRARMAFRPPYLYLTGFGAALGIVDVSDPRRPRWEGKIPRFDHTMNDGFELQGSRGYLLRLAESLEPDAAAPLLLEVLDFGDSARPGRLATLDLGVRMETPNPAGISVAADRVYVVTRGTEEDGSQLFAVDVSVPAHPRVVHQETFPDGPVFRDVEVEGDTLYLLKGRPDPGLAVARIGDQGLEVLGEVSVRQFRLPSDLTVHEGVVFATAKLEVDVAAFDVGDPEKPRLTFTYQIPDRWAAGLGMTRVGNRLFIAGDGGPAPLFDVSTPAQPRHLGSWDFRGGAVGEIAVNGDLLLVGNRGGGAFVYDVSEARDPVRVYRRRRAPSASGNEENGWQWTAVPAVADSTAVVAYTTEPAEVLDLANPAEPRLMATFEPGGFVHAATLRPPHLFVGYRAWSEGKREYWDPDAYLNAGGLEVWRLDPGEEPRLDARIELDAPVTDLGLSRDRILASHPGGGLTLVDLEDPARPTIRASREGHPVETSISFPDRDTRVATSSQSDLAFVVRRTPARGEPDRVGRYELGVMDLGDPDGLRRLSTLPIEQSATAEASVLAVGDHAVVVAGDITLIDAGDPDDPVIRRREPFPPAQGSGLPAPGLAAGAEHLYVGYWEDGVFVYRLPEAVRPGAR